jgi:hypothetical protein
MDVIVGGHRLCHFLAGIAEGAIDPAQVGMDPQVMSGMLADMPFRARG